MAYRFEGQDGHQAAGKVAADHSAAMVALQFCSDQCKPRPTGEANGRDMAGAYDVQGETDVIAA